MTRSRVYTLPRKRLLPMYPSVEFLRKQARRLLRRVQDGDEKALARARASRPAWQTGAPFALHDAQWTLAREYGFESWAKLVRHVDGLNQWQQNVASFSPAELVELLAKRDDIRSGWYVRKRLFDLLGGEGHRQRVRARREGRPARPADEATRAAVLAGMSHPNPRIRAGCAELMDHTADDASVPALRELLRDPSPRVRRLALHSLVCQVCKPEPIEYDPVPEVTALYRSDPSERVRREALGALARQEPDVRVVPILEEVLRDPGRVGSHRYLVRQLCNHLATASLGELLARVENEAANGIRDAALQRLNAVPADARAADVLGRLRKTEPDERLRHRAQRAWRHHTSASLSTVDADESAALLKNGSSGFRVGHRRS